MISIERVKNIAEDIKNDNDWVNDSHEQAEWKGICYGLDLLIRHLEEVQDDR